MEAEEACPPTSERPQEMEVTGEDAPVAGKIVSESAETLNTDSDQPVQDQEPVSNGNGTSVAGEDGHEGEGANSETEAQKEEEKPKEKPKDSFDILLSAPPPPEPESEPDPDPPSELDTTGGGGDADESFEDRDNDKEQEDDDDEVKNEEVDNDDEVTDEPAMEEPEEVKKDSFDAMLEGGSDDKAEVDKKASEDKSEDTKDEATDDKKDEDAASPITTISGDPLEDLAAKDSAEDDDVIVALQSDKVASDDKYYEEVKPEELEYLNTNMPSVDTVYAKLNCTVCAKSVEPIIGTAKGVNRHPHLGIAQCLPCRKFYGDGDWPRTEDGDEYCRMCAQGGDILLCDKCPNAFCKKCIQRNLGSRALREITKSEEWSCLLCDSSPLYSLKAIYYCVYKNQAEMKDRKAKDREKEKARRMKRNETVTNREKEALIKSPKNFLEDNISEAFKTLEVYQKSLETERTRCIKTVKEGISVDMATSITRKLRKLYAVTQKNMDLLDRAIVESYVENYPTESTRIHMGRVAPAEPPPMKRVKKKSKNKIKIKAGKNGKKSGSGKPGRPKKVIQMNGTPVYREADAYVVPSLGSKKKRKKHAESDVECIDVSEDDEYYAPKKKMKPGPASAKKAGKPGPASKKVAGPKSKTGSYY